MPERRRSSVRGGGEDRGMRATSTALLLSAILILGLAPAGCGTRAATLYEKVLGSPTYERITASLTRKKEVHDGLEPRFYIVATRLTKEWATAFSEEYSKIYYLDPARKEQVTSEWKAESDKHEVFFLALFTPDEKANDLDAPRTLWSLRLVGRGEKDAGPIYVRKPKMRPEEIARFFPYFNQWYKGYLAAFPREIAAEAAAEGRPAPGAGPVRLVLIGVQGRAVLSWE